jgi:hypothetical protein
MSGGSGIKDDLREHYTPLPVGTVPPRASGLSWHSRQITAQTAYVFYAPPLKPPAEFDVIDTIVFSQPAGWALIDQALKIVGVERLVATALVKEMLDELPT